MLLHGFTQTSVSWRPVVEAIGRRDPDLVLHRPDLAGHGSADPSEDASSLSGIAERLASRWGRALYVGYSMGGRIALRIAVDRPDAVAGLVLVGATAGIDDPDDRAERRRLDEGRAASIEVGGVDAFLDRWMALPLFGSFRAAADDVAARRANRAEGLAASLRSAGTGTMDPPLWSALPHITAPTVVVAGGDDEKFVALGRRLVDGIGAAARLELLAGCAHTAHLEDPASFARIVTSNPALRR